MIEIWPAIDIINSQNVRLTEGDYGSKTAMGRTPLEAVEFYSGFEQVGRIHTVDLMGALKKAPVEADLFGQLIKAAKKPVQIGGGIRSEETVRTYFDMGATYLIIGTKGLSDPEWLTGLSKKYPGRLYLGLDARGERVALNGWQEESKKTVFDVLDELAGSEIGGVIYTDISKDGRMEGPNVEMTGRLARASKWPVTASGGVRNIDDINRLKAEGVAAAIVGKAANSPEFWRDIR
ncbi:HisA/HisF-related TIM barrel protein [Planococcus lenghuensis]|uniref:1-(5-phosphoribosyl)-5-[(5-phosphoribosylamino)methylideneamino] imidazole-4-carboxamide isomerase n=1 Tax=Planococcus lenghuensis TaxID=2213202 RepID=A0A1Q2L210_9BACL|nr:HisA/HisF-related TIM barrel protein [Planococcus lenghuensis]AQQ54505.1 1-(5-phosphoribosyl)-5-((5-phosphoribosylamino)methylideneamino)imidazole-4-carboxamide isomerase [Planococcus lenghuensis]